MPLLIFIVLAVLLTPKDDYMGKICTVIIVFAVVYFETPILGILWEIVLFLIEIVSGIYQFIAS